MNRRPHMKLNRALQRMASTYSMYAWMLSLRLYRPDLRVPTMVVGIGGDYLQFRYNPKFVLSLSQDHLCGVLHHEFNHVEFGHLWARPEDFPDRRARTIAEETTVNEYVCEPLPGNPLRYTMFKELSAGQSTLERYKLLEGKTDQYDSVDDLMYPDPWRESGEDADDPPSAQIRRMLKRMRMDRALDARLIAEQLELANAPLSNKPIPWSSILRRVGIEIGPRPVYHRPSRRFSHLVGVVPGTTTRGRPRVMAAVDTSGSMSPSSLERISQELRCLACHTSITIVECDDKIRAKYPFSGPLKCVSGRGGTDLRPPLSEDCVRELRPDVVVYFTDGDGKAPERPLPFPVIWALTPGGNRPAPWGEVIEL